MKQKYPLFILLSFIAAGIASLTACSHKNPLINEKNIHLMKANFFFNSADFPIKQCAAYYSDIKWSSPLKKTCEQWSKMYYQKLIHFAQIPATTTLKDFRDPAFWKQVNAAKLW